MTLLHAIQAAPGPYSLKVEIDRLTDAVKKRFADLRARARAAIVKAETDQ